MNLQEFNPGAEAKSAQCMAVLAALARKPQTTTQLRALLGPSSSPAARVLDCRKAGHRIVTQREGAQALYVLLPRTKEAV